MMTNTQRFFLLIVGLLFCILGCARDRSQVLMPDDISPPMEVHETVNVAKATFEQNVLPILTAKCAFSGCHGENPQEGYDYRTYESFIAGGEHGPAFIPGNAEESEVVEEVVEGKMPPPESGRPTLSAAELQTLKDWINQQKTSSDIVPHDDDHDVDDMDAAHDDAEDAHDDMDAVHDGMDDDHDDHDDHGHGDDDADNGHDADDAHDDDHN